MLKRILIKKQHLMGKILKIQIKFKKKILLKVKFYLYYIILFYQKNRKNLVE